MNHIPLKKAIEIVSSKFPLLSLNEKTIMNWAKLGRECEPFKEKGRIYFDEENLNQWCERIALSFLTLNKDDYMRCFEFAVEAYYIMTRSDFNRAKQRDVGEFLTNQIQGKLGEIAVQRKLESYGLEMKLDFDIRGEIPSQDISQISIRKGIWNNPAVKVSIKSTKLKNILLAVPEKEAALADRRSDIYVLSQIGLFPNHILRIIKEVAKKDVSGLSRLVPDFEYIPARIAGWAAYEQLTARSPMQGDECEAEFGINMQSPNYVLCSGQLSYDWDQLKTIIVGK